ncbi:MAG: hypothetical protein ABSD78_09720 [Acidimicrobiales bacterium]|jgi:hypothetical protein
MKPVPSQFLIWTALPNGTLPGNPNVLQLSVIVSPRLMSSSNAAQKLGAYSDWLDWPATKVSFAVNIGTVTIPASQVTVVPPPVPLPTGVTSSQLWSLLFNSSTEVLPANTFSSFAGRLIRSYPAYNVRNFLYNTYSQIASQYPTDYPSYSALIGPTAPQWFGQLPINQQAQAAVIQQINSALTSSGGAIPPGSPDPATDVMQAWLYSQPLGNGTEPPPQPTQPDFHQMVSTLGKYPVLLRAFGLVFDLQVALPSGLPATVGVSVTPTWTPLLTPATATKNSLPAVQATSATFIAAPRTTNPLINSGLLRLSDTLATGEPIYPLTEVDLDGGAIKSLNFVQGITNAVTVKPSLSTPMNYAVPSLRSGGVTLVHTGTAAEFANDQTGEGSLNSLLTSLSPVALYAEDVTQGYRIDALDETTNKWYQLCARVAAGTVYGGSAPLGYVIGTSPSAQTISLPSGNPGTPGPGPGETGAPFDEGWVELSLTQSPPSVHPTSDLYLHESLCRWAGYSLVADRPGMHWAEDSNTAAPNPYNATNPTAFPLQIAHAPAPHTLPLLRFGRVYRFRARAVDLAGNSLVFSSAAPASSLTYASPPLTYGRCEPIATPVCIPAAARTPGEHLLNIVIRSETYKTPPSSVVPNTRHVVPPSLAAEMAEAHGLFDVGGLPSGSAATYDLIANSVGLTYASPSVVSDLGGVADTSWVNSLWPEQVYYYPSTNLGCPYLPELFARGASFQNLPGSVAGGLPFQVSFAAGSKWPAVRPLRIVFHAGTAKPKLAKSSSGNVLNVHAPAGTITTSRLSAYLHLGDLPLMTLWRWLQDAGLATAALQSDITTGQHWMFTPYQEVTFVHAVRTPNPPAITAASIQPRLPGKTYELFSGTIDVDFGGSSKVDLLSSWTTPFDDGTNPAGAVSLPGNAHLADLPLQLADPVPQSITVSDVRHDFGDTKYRLVNYQAQVTSRYLEYFQEYANVTLNTSTPTTINAGGLATGATVVSATLMVGTPPQQTTVTYQPGVDYIEDDVAGTLMLTAGSAISGPVDVRYVAPPVTNVSPVVPLAVVSTARPAAPEIAYILPIFSFDTSSTSSTVTSTRTGNALRVYLDRPWYSSGDGEQLGVVIWPGGFGAPPPPTLAPFVTGYGRDPIRTTNLQLKPPLLTDFLLAESTVTSITLEETAGQTGTNVSIAGHSVQWEGTNHFLWYADIEIDTSLSEVYSYFPFIRLGLVRYQPNSLAGYEVSRVAVADFVQVAPNRFASLTFPTSTTVAVTLSGVGEAAGSPLGLPPSSMTATVQTQLSGVSDPDLQWVDTPGSTVTLGASESPNYSFTWSGTVTLPAARGSESMRIRLTETEYYLYEPPGGVPTYASRIVYLDTLII